MCSMKYVPATYLFERHIRAPPAIRRHAMVRIILFGMASPMVSSAPLGPQSFSRDGSFSWIGRDAIRRAVTIPRLDVICRTATKGNLQ